MRGKSSSEIILHVSFTFLHVLQAKALSLFLLYYHLKDIGRAEALEDSDNGSL